MVLPIRHLSSTLWCAKVSSQGRGDVPELGRRVQKSGVGWVWCMMMKDLSSKDSSPRQS